MNTNRLATTSACLMLLVPGVAFASDGAEAVSVSSLVIAGGSFIVSVLLGLLAWSLKNNVEGFKIAMQQALGEAQKATAKADEAQKDLSRMRIEMAGAITRKDLETLTTSIEQVRRDVATLTTQVAVINHHQRENA